MKSNGSIRIEEKNTEKTNAQKLLDQCKEREGNRIPVKVDDKTIILVKPGINIPEKVERFRENWRKCQASMPVNV